MGVEKASLAKPLGEDTKCYIGHAFFGDGFDHQGGLDAFDEYFKYYQDELKWVLGGMPPGARTIPGIIVQTHEDVIDIAMILREHPDCEKREVREKLKALPQFGSGEDWALDRSIDLTLRLWLQINVRDDESSTGVFDVQWNEHEALTKFLSGLFPIEDWELGAKERRLDPYFTAANMVQICGLTIGWTNSLEDHLRLERREKNEKVLWVYPYKRTLQVLLKEAEVSSRYR